ncbi:hypothetical protein EON67_00875 [archaeon]|nr:MAG: hypothetical protein EON67_00875 [archaeon]
MWMRLCAPHPTTLRARVREWLTSPLQCANAALPHETVQAAGGARHEAVDVWPPRVQYAVREAVRAEGRAEGGGQRSLACAYACAPTRAVAVSKQARAHARTRAHTLRASFPLRRPLCCSFAPYFVEPVVAGLDEAGVPFITAMDCIGAQVFTSDFVVAGTCSENLYGMCESLYRPDMEPEDLMEVISQSLLSGFDRDALSGWGAVVHVITPEGITTKELKTRVD